jgi:hypothetical protein
MKSVGSKTCHSFTSLWWRRTLGGAEIVQNCCYRTGSVNPLHVSNLVWQELSLLAFVGNVEYNVAWMLCNAHASSISE